MSLYTSNQGFDGEAEERFRSLLGEALPAYKIPKAAFDSYRVKRGLREPDGSGVTAGVTKIANAHGYVMYEGDRIADDGKLEFRGYELTTLINNFVKEDRFGFEECAYLLFFGQLPTKEQLESFTALLAACRRLPPRFTEDIIMKAPSMSIMNKMASSVLSLYAYDENPDDTSLENMLRQSIEILARMPIIAAQSYAVYQNAFHDKSLNLHNPKEHLSTAQNFLRVLRPHKNYTEEEAKLLDLCLCVHAEHGGGNCSTFTCRVLSSSGSDTYSAISSAIGALKGPRHGGANLKVKYMLDCIKDNVSDIHDDDEMASFLLKILGGEEGDGSGLIYGMGHAIYTKSDPRAVMLKTYAKKLAYDKGFGEDYELLEQIEKLTPAIFHEYKGIDKPMCANVDLYSGLVYKMLDIPTEMYTPIFATARTAGWCAHRMEEFETSGKIMRPAFKCVTRPKAYTPLNER